MLRAALKNKRKKQMNEIICSFKAVELLKIEKIKK